MTLVLNITPQTSSECLKEYFQNGVHHYYLASHNQSEFAFRQLEILRENPEAASPHHSNPLFFTSVGIIEGEELIRVKRRIERKGDYPNLLKLTDERYFCLSREYLEGWLENLLRETDLKYPDVVLLQAPEWYLREMFDKRELSELQLRLEDILHSAFLLMEEWIREGKIKSYGILSEALGFEQGRKDFLPVETLENVEKKIRRKFGGSHLSHLALPLHKDFFKQLDLFLDNLSSSKSPKITVQRKLFFLIEEELISALLRGEALNQEKELALLDSLIKRLHKQEEQLRANGFPIKSFSFAVLLGQAHSWLENGKMNWSLIEEKFKFYWLQVHRMIFDKKGGNQPARTYLQEVARSWNILKGIHETRNLRNFYRLKERIQEFVGLPLKIEEMPWVYLLALLPGAGVIVPEQALPRPDFINEIQKRQPEIEAVIRDADL